jgi:hypothetical protein
MNEGKYLHKMRTAAFFLCVGGLVAGCGQASSDAPKDQNELLEAIELKPDESGGYIARRFLQTRTQFARERQVRDERAKMFAEGVAASEMTAELSKDASCIDFDALWVWPEHGQSGTRCCISGTGAGYFGPSGDGGTGALNCGITIVWSFYGGVYGGEFNFMMSGNRPYSPYEQDNLSSAAIRVKVNP